MRFPQKESLSAVFVRLGLLWLGNPNQTPLPGSTFIKAESRQYELAVTANLPPAQDHYRIAK